MYATASSLAVMANSSPRPRPRPMLHNEKHLVKPASSSCPGISSTHSHASISHTNAPSHFSIFNQPVTSSTYASILEACEDPNSVRQIHANSIKTGFHGHAFVETKLLQAYGSCCALEDAIWMFEKMLLRNLYSWTAILKVHVDCGLFEEAFSRFLNLLYEETCFQFFVFPVVLKICSALVSLQLGRQVHGLVVKYQFVENIYVGNALIDMYGKCGSLDDAKIVFKWMPVKDCVSWNSVLTACAANGMVNEALDLLESMSVLDNIKPNVVSWSTVISGFSQNLYDEEVIQLLSKMHVAGFEPNAQTLSSVLPACARLQRVRLGKELHGYVTRRGFMSNNYVVNGLLDIYRRCHDMESAFKIFSNFSMKNAENYNSMIFGCCEDGNVTMATELFFQMQQDGMSRERISWNSLISGYVDNSLNNEALRLFKELMEEGIAPDSFTLGSSLTACANMASLRKGKEIHSYAIVSGMHSNPFVGGALVEMYSKCGELPAAQIAFSGVAERNTATWNALLSGHAFCNQAEKIEGLLQEMRNQGFEPNEFTWNSIIAGLVENNDHDLAMRLFFELQTSNWRPDIYTIGTILSACSRLATIQHGKEVHAYSIKRGLDVDVHIGAALVDMYAKCGSVKHAFLAYHRISYHNLVAHNAMLTAYAIHGHGEEGIAHFWKILARGIRPDLVTFLSVLSSCVHAGSLVIGFECFNLMEAFGLNPTLKHYSCMVDLLSRAGQLKEAFELIEALPMEPDSVMWSTFLGGCVIHGNVTLGQIAAKKLIELEPNKTGNYVLLANLYAYAGRWHDVAQTRKLMQDKGMHKTPGCSWVEDRDGFHVFLASDRSHVKTEEIYSILNCLTDDIKNWQTKDEFIFYSMPV